MAKAIVPNGHTLVPVPGFNALACTACGAQFAYSAAANGSIRPCAAAAAVATPASAPKPKPHHTHAVSRVGDQCWNCGASDSDLAFSTYCAGPNQGCCAFFSVHNVQNEMRCSRCGRIEVDNGGVVSLLCAASVVVPHPLVPAGRASWETKDGHDWVAPGQGYSTVTCQKCTVQSSYSVASAGNVPFVCADNTPSKTRSNHFTHALNILGSGPARCACGARNATVASYGVCPLTLPKPVVVQYPFVPSGQQLTISGITFQRAQPVGTPYRDPSARVDQYDDTPAVGRACTSCSREWCDYLDAHSDGSLKNVCATCVRSGRWAR